MKRALMTFWFLWRHRSCSLSGYVTPEDAGLTSLGQKVGIKCHHHIKGKESFDGPTNPGFYSSWGLIILLQRN